MSPHNRDPELDDFVQKMRQEMAAKADPLRSAIIKAICDSTDPRITAIRRKSSWDQLRTLTACVVSAVEAMDNTKADAARYHYLRDHCGGHYGMTHDQPAEWSIAWSFQQITPDEAYGSFDSWIDRDIARQAELDKESWS